MLEMVLITLAVLIPVHMVSYRQGQRDMREAIEGRVLKAGDVLDYSTYDEDFTLEVTSGTVTVEPLDEALR